VNRIAGWGAAISDTFGRPEILGPERYTPEMVKAQDGNYTPPPDATPEKELFVEDISPEVVENVKQDVNDAMTRMLINRDGISQVGILAKLTEAACWPFGSALIINALEATMEIIPTQSNGSKEPLSAASFQQLTFCLNILLPTISSVNDHGSAKVLLEVGSRITCAGADEDENLLKTLKHHNLWKDTGTWSGIFFDMLTATLSQAAKDAGLADGANTAEVLAAAGISSQQVAFMELISVVNYMGILQISAYNIRAFLSEMQTLQMIDEEREKILMEMVIPLPSFEESMGRLTHKELVSPRSKNRSRCSVHADTIIEGILMRNESPEMEIFVPVMENIDRELSNVVFALDHSGIQDGGQLKL